MLRTTAHEQLRRTNPAKGYVAGRRNASTVAVTSDLGARPDKARLLHPPLWDLSFQTFAGRRYAWPVLPPGGRGPHLIFQADFDNRLESHRNPAIHPKFEFQDGLLGGRLTTSRSMARPRPRPGGSTASTVSGQATAASASLRTSRFRRKSMERL